MRVSALSVLVLLAGWQTAFAQQPSRQEVVVAGKRATALVVDAERVTGTAVCIDAGGYFVTSFGVLRRPGTASLVLDSGLESQRVVKAEVVVLDAESGFAMLYTPEAEGLHALPLGADTELIETAEVLLFGFPVERPRIQNEQFPSIGVSIGHVTSLRRVGGSLTSILFDAELQPAYVGGPVVDNSGRIVGLINRVSSNSSVHTANPKSTLQPFLRKVDIAFAPPRVSVEKSHEPIEIEARVAALNRTQGIDVHLELSSSPLDHRTIPLPRANHHTYKAAVVPVPEMGAKNLIPIEAQFPLGEISCRVEGGEVRIDGRAVPLDQIERIKPRDDRFIVVLRDAETFMAKSLEGFPTRANLGGYELPIDLLQANELSLKPPEVPGVLNFAVVVTENGNEIARQKGEWRLVTPDGETSPGGIMESAETTAGFLPLRGDAPWPEFLEPSPGGIFEERGLRTHPERCIRSSSANLLEEDFVFEVEFEFKPAGDGIACVGIGEAVYDRQGPLNCVYLRLHPTYHGNGEIGLAKHPSGHNSIPAGLLRTHGPHRVKILKRGYSVSFSVDIDNDGPTPDDTTRTIPDIRTFAPFIHGKNMRVFFAAGGTYSKVRFHRLSLPTASPELPDEEISSPFVPWPQTLDPASDAVVSEAGLKLGERQLVKSKIGGFATKDFTVELEFTLPTQGREIGIVGFGAITPGADHPFDQSIFLRLHSLHHGDGKVGLNVRGRPEAPAGQFRTHGPHLVRIQRKGNSLTFHIDVGKNGESPDDVTKTVMNIKQALPILHEKNTQFYFGSGQYQAIRISQP